MDPDHVNPDHVQLSPAQAREQLGVDQRLSVSSRTDRRAHAIATAVFGLALGVYMAARNVTSVHAVVAGLGFVAVVVWAQLWVERASSTVPRRTKLWSGVGLGSSLLLALALVVPWLNLQAQAEPNTWPMVLLAALIIAAPSLAAAAVVSRGRR